MERPGDAAPAGTHCGRLLRVHNQVRLPHHCADQLNGSLKHLTFMKCLNNNHNSFCPPLRDPGMQALSALLSCSFVLFTLARCSYKRLCARMCFTCIRDSKMKSQYATVCEASRFMKSALGIDRLVFDPGF